MAARMEEMAMIGLTESRSIDLRPELMSLIILIGVEQVSLLEMVFVVLLDSGQTVEKLISLRSTVACDQHQIE